MLRRRWSRAPARSGQRNSTRHAKKLLLAVSSLLGCWDQPRKLHVCPGRYGIVVGSRVRGRSRDARPGVSSSLPVTCYTLNLYGTSGGAGP
jgi:hypothetical protein